MKIEIDINSGFCFGVKRAIGIAEEALHKGSELYCLGDIVHNQEEVDRLSKLKMKTVQKDTVLNLNGKTVMIRSHGEPVSTYKQLEMGNNTIVDATCPVVLKLQKRIRESYEKLREINGQLVIFGKKEHLEVVGLNGQIDEQAIVVSKESDLGQIDFSRPVELYSQTTMPLEAYWTIRDTIREKARNQFVSHDTICRQVANRVPQLLAFSKKYDIILFVSGTKSSNGRMLYEVCRNTNPETYFISAPAEIDAGWLADKESLGICGATSTPQWLMEAVAMQVKLLLKEQE